MKYKREIKYVIGVCKVVALMLGAFVGVAFIDVGNDHNWQFMVTIGFVMNFSCLIYLGMLLKGDLKL